MHRSILTYAPRQTNEYNKFDLTLQELILLLLFEYCS
jgi:hypothetical protein